MVLNLKKRILYVRCTMFTVPETTKIASNRNYHQVRLFVSHFKYLEQNKF